MFNPTPPVSCTFGAPLGRPTKSGWHDRDYNWHALEVLPDAPPFHLVKVPLDRDGYDKGGAYWGLGEQLWAYQGPVSDISGYVRAHNRAAAKAAVREAHPNARFFR